MTAGESTTRARPEELEEAIRTFASLLPELQSAHAALAARAERVEADLCRANAELAARVAELEAVLSCLPTGVVVRDAAGVVTRANRPALAILGAAEEQVVGAAGWPGLAGPEAGGELRELVRSDGARLLVAGRYAEIRLPEGERTGSVEVLDDRTDLEAMRDRMHRQGKMAALGTMAGGIAHEIRNPLNAVRGFAALLADRVEPASTEQRWAGRVIEGVDECNAIVSSMLTLADPERLSLETISAREWVAETLALCLREPAERARWPVDVDVEDVSFAGDRLKLRQALRNLVANAIEAQPDGGALRVEVRRAALPCGGCELVARVADAGPGIPPADLDRVADPFFTTHADGTGLGLSLVHTIARLHGGSLEISPAPGPLGGADLRIHIPLQPSE